MIHTVQVLISIQFRILNIPSLFQTEGIRKVFHCFLPTLLDVPICRSLFRTRYSKYMKIWNAIFIRVFLGLHTSNHNFIPHSEWK